MKLFIDAGLSILPGKMDTIEARAMLYAIGLQESRFTHRKQMRRPRKNKKRTWGPARGFWQFEPIGIKGVLYHGASSEYIWEVAGRLKIKRESGVLEAVAYNDALACAFARLLLWTLPEALPAKNEPKKGWDQYISGWRPGKPHPETWDKFFNKGWEIALKERNES